jgi:hypothetical protein
MLAKHARTARWRKEMSTSIGVGMIGSSFSPLLSAPVRPFHSFGRCCCHCISAAANAVHDQACCRDSSRGNAHGHYPDSGPNTLALHFGIVAAVLVLGGIRKQVVEMSALSVSIVVSAAPPANLMTASARHVRAPAVFLNSEIALAAFSRVKLLPPPVAKPLKRTLSLNRARFTRMSESVVETKRGRALFANNVWLFSAARAYFIARRTMNCVWLQQLLRQ